MIRNRSESESEASSTWIRSPHLETLFTFFLGLTMRNGLCDRRFILIIQLKLRFFLLGSAMTMTPVAVCVVNSEILSFSKWIWGVCSTKANKDETEWWEKKNGEAAWGGRKVERERGQTRGPTTNDGNCKWDEFCSPVEFSSHSPSFPSHFIKSLSSSTLIFLIIYLKKNGKRWGTNESFGKCQVTVKWYFSLYALLDGEFNFFCTFIIVRKLKSLPFFNFSPSKVENSWLFFISKKC